MKIVRGSRLAIGKRLRVTLSTVRTVVLNREAAMLPTDGGKLGEPADLPNLFGLGSVFADIA